MFNSIKRAMETRRRESVTRRELSALTDHELQDLGLMRCDISRVAREHVAMELSENEKLA